MNAAVRLGLRYRCAVCGAEVLTIRAGSQALEPHCCNRPMEPRDLVPVYRCEICGSEVALLRGDGEAPELFCCNQPMVRREAPIPEAA